MKKIALAIPFIVLGTLSVLAYVTVSEHSDFEVYNASTYDEMVILEVQHSEETYNMSYGTFYETTEMCPHETASIRNVVWMQMRTTCNLLRNFKIDNNDPNHLDMFSAVFSDDDLPRNVLDSYDLETVDATVYDSDNFEVISECVPDEDGLNIDIDVDSPEEDTGVNEEIFVNM